MAEYRIDHSRQQHHRKNSKYNSAKGLLSLQAKVVQHCRTKRNPQKYRMHKEHGTSDNHQKVYKVHHRVI